MTSTSTGNIGAALKVQPYPLSDTAVLGPRRGKAAELRKDLLVRQTDSDGYTNLAGNIPSTFLGTPGTSWAVKEYGDNSNRKTILTSTAPIVLPAVTGAANQAIGVLVYTLPAVDQAIGFGAKIRGSITAAVTPAATPVSGLGTAIGTGAVAALAATMRDVVGSNAIGAANGTVFNFADSISTFKLSTTPPQVFLNFANNWAAADTITVNTGFQIIFSWNPLADIEQSGYNVI